MTHTDDPRLQLAPPPERASTWLFLLCVPLPVAITAAALLTVPGDSAQVLIGDSLPLTVAVTLAGVALISLAVWYPLARAMQRQQLLLTDVSLQLQSTFYRCDVPLRQLQLERARVIDLDEHPQLRPRKSNGFSVPGLRSGWFRSNGRRTFVALADGRRTLWIPSSGGHDLLIEPRDPRALLDRLRASAA
ncbi:hypothetical protein [Xanthomonas sp. XNM01]|uniref:hypothetical protein n=1 Tax=Xanthomonas sp. XNM01 TaxID=2769289 RepID=UPI00177B8D60|nr:hypothetical protein [Xanthomonas sp. XNM01]MBD9368664.1 hypothetical protein [Xanthomonas sp. XNM01]